jgi:uncharacterized membrane protein YuzA (DUF378 family)
LDNEIFSLINNNFIEKGVFMYILKVIAYVLVIIGAINWGLIGFFGFDLVASLFGEMSVLSRIVYGLVGVSALVLLILNRDIFHDYNI